MTRALDWAHDRHGWPNSGASRFVDVDGLRWHVQVMGQGPALLLLHGTAASTHSWRELAPLLSQTFTVIAPDLPGHGFTQSPSRPAMTLPGMADGVRRLLAYLGFDPKLVVGHSAGAAILIRMCLDRMITPRQLVSLNGAILPFQPAVDSILFPMAKLLVANPLAKRLITWHATDVRNVARLIRGTGSSLTEDGLQHYARLFQSYEHVSGAITMMANWDLQALQDELSALQTPITLVAGENDRSVPPDCAHRLGRTFPDAQVVVLQGLGHLAHEERPAEIARIILQRAESQTKKELAPAA